MRVFLLAAALSMLAASSASAQGQQQPQTPRPEDTYVTSKMFQNRVFEVKNRDPHNLVHVLSPLGSGFKGAVMFANREFRTITVRDFPENIAVVEEAIRRFDQPEPARPGIEFRVHFLLASNDAAAAAALPSELGDIARQLQSSLGYKSFSLIGSQVLRSKEGPGLTHNKGVADLRLGANMEAGKAPTTYSYHIRDVRIEARTGAAARVLADEFNFQMRVAVPQGPEKYSLQEVGFQSPVLIREGERVVVGTAGIADKSVVVVLSATTVK
jgi:hypothetical protein